MKNLKKVPSADHKNESKSFSRKKFLKRCGLSTAGVAVGLSGCTEVPNAVVEEHPLQLEPDPSPQDNQIWIGSGDIGLMNTINVDCKVQAAFFETLLTEPYDGMTSKEESLLTDIKLHKVAHRDFLDAYLRENTIQDIHFTFGGIDFTSRYEVLNKAFDFANVGTGIYNCFGPMIERNFLFSLLTKIASVEARHAVSLKFLLDPSSNFLSNQIINNRRGLDTFINPQLAWATFRRYIIEDFDISGLPKQQFDTAN